MGYGWQPYFVSGEEPWSMHAKMAQTLDRVFDQIATFAMGSDFDRPGATTLADDCLRESQRLDGA